MAWVNDQAFGTNSSPGSGQSPEGEEGLKAKYDSLSREVHDLKRAFFKGYQRAPGEWHKLNGNLVSPRSPRGGTHLKVDTSKLREDYEKYGVDYFSKTPYMNDSLRNLMERLRAKEQEFKQVSKQYFDVSHENRVSPLSDEVAALRQRKFGNVKVGGQPWNTLSRREQDKYIGRTLPFKHSDVPGAKESDTIRRVLLGQQEDYLKAIAKKNNLKSDILGLAQRLTQQYQPDGSQLTSQKPGPYGSQQPNSRMGQAQPRQPSNPYGGQPYSPYGGQQAGFEMGQAQPRQPASPYGGQPYSPYGGQPYSPYGGQPYSPYGVQPKPQSGSGGQPKQQAGYGGQPYSPYGGQQAGFKMGQAQPRRFQFL